jgi:hypothetical protein
MPKLIHHRIILGNFSCYAIKLYQLVSISRFFAQKVLTQTGPAEVESLATDFSHFLVFVSLSLMVKV